MIATKADLAELRGEMNAQFARIESDLLWMKRIGAAIIVAASGFAFSMLIEMSTELAAMETALVALASGGGSGALTRAEKLHRRGAQGV